MAAPKSQRDNADAFDDLLGQLVDELAMTPTMVPEPEPEPEPEPPPPAPIQQEVYHAPAYDAPPPKSNVMPIAIGGGIGFAGIVIAIAMIFRGGGDDDKKADKTPPVAEAKKEAPTPPPPQPVVAQPIPGQPGQPGQVGAVQPGLPAGTGLPGQPVPGQPIPGQPIPGQPGDPNTVAAGTPPATPDADAGKKAAKKPKKPTGGGGGGGTKKAEPTKKKSEVVDPFG